MIKTREQINSVVLTKITLVLCSIVLFACKSSTSAQEAPSKHDKQKQLVKAAKTGDINTVEKLLKDESINVNCNSGEPLRAAAAEGYVAIINELLAHQDILPNIKFEKHRHTPLIVAVRNGQLNSIIRLIADERVDVNQPDGSGRTPLYLSIELYFQEGLRTPASARIQNNGIETVKILTQNQRVDVNKGEDLSLLRNYPLELALAKRWEEAVEVLTQHPNIDIKNIEKHYPHALRNYNNDGKEQDKEIANLLAKRAYQEKVKILEGLQGVPQLPSELNTTIANLLYCQLQ